MGSCYGSWNAGLFRTAARTFSHSNNAAPGKPRTSMLGNVEYQRYSSPHSRRQGDRFSLQFLDTRLQEELEFFISTRTRNGGGTCRHVGIFFSALPFSIYGLGATEGTAIDSVDCKGLRSVDFLCRFPLFAHVIQAFVGFLAISDGPTR